MRIHFFFTALLVVFATHVAVAQERNWLGKARLFNNDFIGDGQDRWRTGSYSVSGIRGSDWNGKLPDRLGALMEYRLRTEIIAPANLQNPVLGGDRPYVGAISLGATSYVDLGGTDMALGLDLVFTGPQTGLGSLQSWVHQTFGLNPPQVLGSQVGNAIYPTVNVEFGRDVRLTPEGRMRVSLRPFVEAQAGVETYLRLGGDLTFGNAGLGDMQVRDPVTGYRNIAVKGHRTRGVSLLLGGDVAYVAASRYLPASRGYVLVKPRTRLRAGLYGEGAASSFFYGLTWLGREFAWQKQGQVLGSVTIRLNF